MQQEPEVHLDSQDARQGKRGTKVSFVLAISLGLAVLIGVFLYLRVY